MTINEMKQSYKQSYTDNVELSIFNCGHEYCQPGQPSLFGCSCQQTVRSARKRI